MQICAEVHFMYIFYFFPSCLDYRVIMKLTVKTLKNEKFQVDIEDDMTVS